MSSVLSSQGIAALATAMVVSCTAIYLVFSAPKLVKTPDSEPPPPNLRSCLCKGDRRKKKKKRVQFSENVKDTRRNGEEYRRDREKKSDPSTGIHKICRNEIQQESQRMPANRVALYNGILRDRVHRLQCSY